MRVGVYPGSFDPFHIGHEDVVKKALRIFDGVVVAIGVHPNKEPIFSVLDRKVMIEQTFKDEPNISVQAFEGLLIDLLAELEDYDETSEIFIIRGLRNEADFETESQMALANKAISENKNETIFFMTEPSLSYVSSTLIRELLHYEQSCEAFLPKEVLDIIEWRKSHPKTLLIDSDVKELVTD